MELFAGADPGFQVRGGELKKIAPSEGRCENFWGISCEKSRFYAKKSYFFQFYRGRAPDAPPPPPWIRPWFVLQNTLYIVFHVICMLFTYANNLARCIK
jgi:hypothetical protein